MSGAVGSLIGVMGLAFLFITWERMVGSPSEGRSTEHSGPYKVVRVRLIREGYARDYRNQNYK